MMGVNKRTKQQREHDLVIVAQMYFEGKYQSEIGAFLGLSQQQISYDLKVLEKRWVKNSLHHITQGKARELAKIDHLEREYWQAWKDSDCPDNGSPGNPAYLSGVQWCINKRCQILGFEAASRHINIDMSKLNDGQLQRLASGEDLYSVVADSGTGPS